MLAARIATAREKHLSFTQKELGERMGVDAMTVSRWERGIVEPRPRHLRKLSEMTGLPVSWFFDEEPDPVEDEVAA